MCVWYKHNLGVLRVLCPVMVTFQNVTKHFSYYKICQDQPVMFSFDFKIKLLSLNVGHDLS